AREIGVAAMMVLPAMAQKIIGIRIATRTDHIMHRAAKFVETIPVETVVSDGGHRTQVRKTGEQLVSQPHMGSVERARLAAIEFLVEIVRIEQIEVPDLRPLAAQNTAKMAGRNGPTLRIPRLHGDAFDKNKFVTKAAI